MSEQLTFFAKASAKFSQL